MKLKVQDRIKELRRVKASELKSNPKNWRKHPSEQESAMRGVLKEVGIADAVLARELEDGSLELIDGHLRKDLDPDLEWPVLVLDVTESEADVILATHDPLSTMAKVDQQMLDSLVADIDVSDQGLNDLLGNLSDAITTLGDEETIGKDSNATVPSNEADADEEDDDDEDEVSNVRLIQLFYTDEQNDRFLEIIETIQEIDEFDDLNTSEICLKALEQFVRSLA